VFLNEFLRGFEDLLGASYRLLRNSSCNATDSLGDRFRALGYT